MIDPATRIGAVHLTIADLDRSIRFYETHLGFALLHREGRTARLGAGGPELLVLSENPGAPRVRGTTGLYHFAILVPSRPDLARALRRLADTSTAMQGAADHGVSEALYLADPDGNGIEIYRDRPRGEWPFVDGRLHMTTDSLDFDDLLTASAADRGDPRRGLDADTVIGHVHLHVAHIAESDDFYAGVLGFDPTQRYGPSALFVSAGGYHHHVGLNTWAGVGAPAPPRGAIGLQHFEVTFADKAALAAVESRVRAAGAPIEADGEGLLVRDPASNAMLLRVR